MKTWNEIFEAAIETACWSPELKAKDTARAYVTDICLEVFGVNIDDCECPEDAIDEFLSEHPEYDKFDESGRMILEEVENE